MTMFQASSYLESRLAALSSLAGRWVGEPDLKNGEKAAAVVRLELESVQALIKASSSSNPGYECKDLAPSDRINLESAVHFSKILTALYPAARPNLSAGSITGPITGASDAALASAGAVQNARRAFLESVAENLPSAIT